MADQAEGHTLEIVTRRATPFFLFQIEIEPVKGITQG